METMETMSEGAPIEEPKQAYKLSPLQRRLWLLQEGGRALRCQLRLGLAGGPVDPGRLRQALGAPIRRHEALRTTFERPSGLRLPVQSVVPEAEPVWREEDLSALDPRSRAERVEALAGAESFGPGDLESGPVLRALLLRLAADDHLLILTLPSLCADGRSLANLAAEIASHLAGEPGEEEPVQYAQFAEWQNGLEEDPDAQAGLRFWQEALMRCAPAAFPWAGPPRGAASAGPVELEVEPETLAPLDLVARDAEAGLHDLLLAAWTVLLWRLSGGRVTVGVVADGRGAYEELHGMLGPCSRPLPVSFDLYPDLRFSEVLADVARAAAEAVAQQDLFGVAAGDDEALNPFDREILYEWGEDRALPEAGPLRLTVESWTEEVARPALRLFGRRGPGSLRLRLEHDPARLDGADLPVLAERLRALLADVARRPDVPLGALDLLGPEPRRRLLGELDETRSAVPPGAFVHRLVARSAAAHPGDVAVEHGPERLTYGELDAFANRVARFLRRRRVGPDVVVGIQLGRSLELLPVLLGVLKAGGAYLPVDPALPAVRRAWLLADAGCRLVLGADVEPEGVPEGTEVLDLRARRAEIDAESAVDPAVDSDAAVDGDSLAYVIYTSGSTGTPKGAMISHRGLANYLLWAAGAYAPPAGGVVPVHSAVGFDLTVTGLFVPLLTGACVSLVPEEGGLDALCAEMSRPRPLALLKLTPAHLAALDRLLPVEEVSRRLATLVVGGEALHAEAVRRWLVPGGARIVNEYGPTETVVGCSVHEVLREAEGGVPIGRPIAGIRLRVLDGRLELALPGVPGELFVAGAGLARGYLGRPDLTAGRFLPDPWAEAPGERMYRTGDLVRLRPDGNLEFLGRVDRQVKIRGHRVEPGEVEAALAGYPAVAEAAVVVQGESAESRRLVAFWTARDGAAATEPDELRAWLAERLPEALLPAAFARLEEMPLTANGKVDRARLAALETDPARRGRRFVAPRTPAETELAELWRELLNCGPVGVHDSFFELGGHSLLATRLMARVARTFAVSLPLQALFKGPTVAELAAEVARARAEAGEEGGAIPAISAMSALPDAVPDPGGRFEPFPLTDVQHAYWIGRSGAVELGNVASHGYLELEAAGLDLERLTRALRRLIERHDMMRMIVRPDGLQQVHEQVPPYEIAVLDLRGLPAEEVEDRLSAVRGEMSHQVLAADRWPLFDIRAALLDGGRIRLQVSRDALLFDAWSSLVLSGELARLYRDPDAELEALQITFRDYVLAEERLRETDLYRRDERYWLDRLETLPPAPDLPLAGDPASLGRPRFARRGSRIDGATWARLRALGVEAGLTPSGIFLAAFAEILARWSRSPRFTLNLTLFNRLPLHPQVDHLVGDFTSLVLLEVDGTRDDPFALRARRLQERLWADLDHCTVGGVRVLREVARRRRTGLGALMPVVLTSTLARPGAAPADVFGGEGPGGRVVHSITQTPQVWLDHQVYDYGDGVGFNWDFVEGLFPEGMVDDMFAAYLRLLESLAAGGEAWTRREPCDLPAEQLARRARINATGAPVADRLLHELFLDQVAQGAERPAVVAPSRVLSYGDLERRSAALAREIRAARDGSAGLVAVVMEKGWEQVVAVLGILRAGAAYVPIDPALPRERLWHLLAESDAVLAVTQPWLDGRLEWPAGVRRLAVAGDDEPAGEAGEGAPAGRPEDLAYVIYTSGSTGRPKGVMIDHRGAVNTILDVNERFGVGESDRIFGLSSLSFDLSVYDIFGTLAAGAALVLPEPQPLPDPAHWAEMAARCGVTVWNSVPALMELFVEHLEERREAVPAGLRLALLSGDWIPVGLPDRISARWAGARVISLGGATEASIWSILYPVGEVGADWPSIPYGRPMRNQAFHVLDGALEPRPDWAAGELYIGGLGLALGYWRDEEKTRERFLLHPRTGERLYRTGDLGRYLPDGDIEFLGREDFQVKVQGHRVELGEIESALAEHPAVRSALAGTEGEGLRRRLVAWVVPHPGEEVDADALRAHLAGKLPAYMVPHSYVPLAALPLTPHGKVDRRALPTAAAAAVVDNHQEPATDLERLLAAVWRDLLGLDRVSVEDNFFELGGNSVTLVRMFRRLNGTVPGELAIGDLIRHPTIRALAQHLERPAATDTAAPREELVLQARQEGRSRLQQRLERGRRAG